MLGFLGLCVAVYCAYWLLTEVKAFFTRVENILKGK